MPPKKKFTKKQMEKSRSQLPSNLDASREAPDCDIEKDQDDERSAVLSEEYTESANLIDTTNLEAGGDLNVCPTPSPSVAESIADETKKSESCMIKEPRPWQSLGSDEEIDSAIGPSTRNILKVEIQTEYPMMKGKVTFKMQMVNDSRDGYVEIRDRQTYENVSRRTLDKPVQVINGYVTTEIQTVSAIKRNFGTVYEAQFCPTDPETDASCNKFVTSITDKFIDMIITNNKLNLYENDYGNICTLCRYIGTPKKQKDFFSLQDVEEITNCLVSCVAWHPESSSLIAVSHSNVELNVVCQEPGKIGKVPNVLVWSFDDTLRPKLYLETNKTVTHLVFSPDNGNLLIGGCENGQIIIWDITNRIRDVEKKIKLTSTQEMNQNILDTRTSWISKTDHMKYVRPCAYSDPKLSHIAPIRYITFISCNHMITNQGKYIRMAEGKKSNQFLTVSLDGSIRIWDLNYRPKVLKKSKSRKNDDSPEYLGLNLDFSSPYQILNKIFKPFYKVNIIPTGEQVKLSVSAVTFNKVKTSEPVTVETDPGLRTALGYGQQDPKEIILATLRGRMFQVYLNGNDHETDSYMSEETADIKKFTEIHDGPITRCVANHFNCDFILTVGGYTFAIWHVDFKLKPIYWKRNRDHRYTNGSWFTKFPSSVILTLSNGEAHIWDFASSSREPSGKFFVSNAALLKLYSSVSMTHNRQGKVIVTDNSGVLRVFDSEGYISPLHKKDYEKVANILESDLKRKNNLLQWNEKIKKTFECSKEHDFDFQSLRKQTKLIEKPKCISKEIQKIKHDIGKFEAQRIKAILIDKHKIKLKELEKMRGPLLKIENEKRIRKRKVEKRIAKKDEIFKNVKHTLLELQEELVLEEIESVPDEYYLQNYKLAEEMSLELIQTHAYIPHKEEIDKKILNVDIMKKKYCSKRYREYLISCQKQNEYED